MEGRKIVLSCSIHYIYSNFVISLRFELQLGCVFSETLCITLSIMTDGRAADSGRNGRKINIEPAQKEVEIRQLPHSLHKEHKIVPSILERKLYFE